MRPDHEFKVNFSPAEPTADAASTGQTDTLTLHKGESPVRNRNLCLVWPDGRRAFFNYAYLVAGDLTMQDTGQVLLLSFGSYTVSLKGYNLVSLFDALLEHSPKIITAVNPRYVADQNPPDSVVIELVVSRE